jgi:hypothetical protein
MTSVTIINDNVISQQFLFTDRKRAEERYCEIIRELDPEFHEEDGEMEMALEDGFCELSFETVCIGQPEIVS